METSRATVRSLRMAEPAEVAGRWNVSVRGRQCTVRLGTGRVEDANAYGIDEGAACLGDMLGKAVAGWRPAPDGIELAGLDRLTIVLFADQGDGSGRADVDGQPATLARAAG
ncbi:hypothetical protein GGQ80_000695 [Sphingomonas jinjuensis]|uniref:Alkaline proteinase inhibitor/ Outer membrane lipoprotein Omp19 domain-containing protein n=1 Tax=Sphingomonas jinjuensis TaxID=535907 RepID=A0A840FBA5_9SPHN|nr:AprI/Inh family metalloprotease inhibitor [Sphingomonas jinjuensis]MBB4152807.1 hypothetical protein [Sphingomonas jinjuensis]